MLQRAMNRKMITPLNLRPKATENTRLFSSYRKRRYKQWPDFGAQSRLSNAQQNRHNVFCRIFVYYKVLGDIWANASWKSERRIPFVRFADTNSACNN